MTWTHITPQETAAEQLVNLMITIDQRREVYERTGAPKEAANLAHVSDELFATWEWLCGQEPLSTDAAPRDSFRLWSTGERRVAA